jgi:hypothetical protein
MGQRVPVRMTARLVELAMLLERLPGTPADDGPCRGSTRSRRIRTRSRRRAAERRADFACIAWVAGGLVASYQIVAPTE